ncbi:Oidioi.mRNA.OKI2018_I69.XSR.g16102.t2.cds [Oikopleura dioica]|uniref:Oidioi.mRNA.OKI2018_I69.XSR.g16102.t2.cds n=1 Tax=Oikopleura dioica TaxID=34765 RepID=A0ABN7SK46_OIKDI|nr:Oidioi.mRNA.OKI2018_I69.XSR.g16102.t2.cds [Oikopleura dioica]
MRKFRPPLVIEEKMTDEEAQCIDELKEWKHSACAQGNRFSTELPHYTLWGSPLSTRPEKILYLIGVFAVAYLRTMLCRMLDSKKPETSFQMILCLIFKLLFAVSGLWNVIALTAFLLGIFFGNISAYIIKVISAKLASCRSKIKKKCAKAEKKRGVLNPTFQHFSVIDRNDISRVRNNSTDDVYLQPRSAPVQKLSESDSTGGYITVENPNIQRAVHAEVYDESDYYSVAVNKDPVYESPYEQSKH